MLPGTECRAVWVFWLFVAVQLADAAQTASGISRFGPSIEANPILAFLVAAVGTSAALIGAKTIAVIGGAALHVWSHHSILAALTAACVFGALIPWAVILNT
jgi:hypothetical protein